MKKFDTKRFLTDNWRDVNTLLEFLHAYGCSNVKRPMICQWFQRAKIPSGWVFLLLVYIEIEHGKPVSLVRYLK